MRYLPLTDDDRRAMLATVGGPVAMGYVRADLAAIGNRLHLMVRGKALPAKVAAMPFVPHRYHR